MTETAASTGRIVPPAEANWGAVWSISLTVVCLVTAELLPVSLLTPMAADLGVTEGMAGQAVSATSVVGMLSSLFIASATRGIDRRIVLLRFTACFIASNILVGAAPNYFTLLIGRLLLGAAIGGFWSMSASVSLRLVPEQLVPKALSIIFGGLSLALVLAGPVGSFFGSIVGWRWVFRSAAIVGVAAFVWQFVSLPSMPPHGRSSLKTLFGLLLRPNVGLGILASTFVHGGYFAFFTYIRPFLETVAGVDARGVSAIFLGFGIANIVGTALSGAMVQRSLSLTLALVPLAMAIVAGCLALFGDVTIVAAALVAMWGFAFGAVPVAWTTWLTRSIPDETESAGGLQVAAIQMSMAIGAGLGGLMIDASGPRGVIVGAGSVLLVASALIFLTRKPVPAMRD